MRRTLACVFVLVVIGLAIVFRPSQFDQRRQVSAEAQDPSERKAARAAVDPVTAARVHHPLLGSVLEAVFDESGSLSSADSAQAHLIQETIRSTHEGNVAAVTIDYPLNESAFPPEFVSPTILWHDETEETDTWLFQFTFGGDLPQLCALTPGSPPPAGRIDPTCVAETNEIHPRTAYQATAKSWTPSGELWEAIKGRGKARPVHITVLGVNSVEPDTVRSRGEVVITVSRDPVGAPIFYRDVPLAPSKSEKGVIKPLSDVSLPLIAWRLRDISRPESRLLLTGMLSCANCHSFSNDGSTLGMDLDGPSGDKGAYVIAPIAKQTVVEQKNVISWNSFEAKPEDHKTIGFLSQLSPDGQYAVTTLNESVYVQNFTDYRFLQVFYPTRGILGYYSRATDEIKALAGADDPNYVHCDPTWSPDGKFLVFSRAEARDSYPEGYEPATHAGDPAETQIQYDLYRIPFNDGRGGAPEPVAGASKNGASNTFPKISPDGKWIVFVKCRNGQLMRPDSTLWIVPVGGGAARQMRCNTELMNSWHSFSPNGRWMVFSSKTNTPYTQMFLTHIDEDGQDTPAILIPNSTADNRAVNIPEFVNVAYEDWVNISVPAMDHRRLDLTGIELFEEGKLDEAMEQFDAAAKSQPDYLEARASMAVVLIEKGQIDEAIRRLQEIVEIDAECWFAQFNLGVALGKKGLIDDAIPHLVAARDLQPKQPHIHAALGTALAHKGLYEEATIPFQRAVELLPGDVTNRLNLANAFLMRGMNDEAVEQFEKALDVAPELVHPRLALGCTLVEKGDYASAVAQFRKAVQIAPQNLDAVNELAWFLATCPDESFRDGVQSAELAEGACRLTGYKDALLMRTLAVAYAEQERWADAIATASRALEAVRPQDESLAQDLRQELESYRQEAEELSAPNTTR